MELNRSRIGAGNPADHREERCLSAAGRSQDGKHFILDRQVHRAEVESAVGFAQSREFECHSHEFEATVLRANSAVAAICSSSSIATG